MANNWMRDHATGKEAYHKLDTVSESKAALAWIRNNIVHIFPAAKMKKERLEQEIKEINETYTPQAAAPKIAEKRNAFKRDIETYQNKLREQLASVLQAKREASRKYVMIPPSADQLTLLNTLKLRGVKNIDDTEWQMYISTLAGNYQCAQILATLARDGGRDFIPPVTSMQDMEQELTLVENWLNEAINNLSKPEDLSYRTMEILADRDNTPSAQLINKLDTEILSTVPSGSLTLKNRLKEAAQNALHVGQMDLFNQIYAFISDNRANLETPEEAQANFRQAAEELIDAGNNAKEKTPQQRYAENRDRLLAEQKQATEGKGNDQG